MDADDYTDETYTAADLEDLRRTLDMHRDYAERLRAEAAGAVREAERAEGMAAHWAKKLSEAERQVAEQAQPQAA